MLSSFKFYLLYEFFPRVCVRVNVRAIGFVCARVFVGEAALLGRRVSELTGILVRCNSSGSSRLVRS